MMLNRADECRQRADECRHNAAQVADDVLRGTYLDLARRWRMMANQAESLEQKEETKKTRGFRIRLLTIALVVIAGSAAISGPALAQVYWGDRSSGGWGDRRSGGWGWDDWGDRRRRQTPSDFFSPFFGDRYSRPAPAVDSSKAPPARKLETPPTSTVMVIGDSLADWLAHGLDEFYADHPEIGFERKISPTSGLIRYDAKNDRLDWSQITKDTLAAEKPNAIIVMLGLNDRLPIREKALSSPEPQRKGEQRAQAAQAPQNSAQGEAATSADSKAAPPAENKVQHPAPGGSYDFQTDQWAALYAKRIDAMIAALKSNGVPIIWVGLPAMRGTKSTRDIGYLDELYRERAEKAGIVYVDVWDGFVDDQGRYAIQGPDFEGQTRRLRAADGVHFTKAGAVKLDRPDLLPQWKDLGNVPPVDEYLRRQALSAQNYSDFLAQLEREFPDDSFLLVRFGDHQPDFAAHLIEPELDDAGIERRLMAYDPRYFTTYYAIDAINFAPVDTSSALDSLEGPYLPLIVQEAAGLPLDPSFAEQKKILIRCNGLFFGCANGAEARHFNRMLIDAGLIKNL
jgi:hypothetical protein